MRQPKPTLRPCPFCGGEAVITRTNHETWISCENYHYARHLVSVRASTEEEAVASWNTRASVGKEAKRG